ncbi:hypothetical protein M2447_002639 [Ereboglobus sp. PH5-10]|uniref:hypothetical protein n=1 Tax=Ereboglobus sp. PH5-10 TaxID=2940629 RepID=UPI0024052E28|nr:hypothetical protein [Ereboglobus sp. PH5-10]MDF9828516.1 hypothetical protein [Ereboglobus sp. PH5-10]
MSAELRITDTNSANDSKGRALGFEGNDFVYVVVGIVAAIGLFLVLYAMLGAAPVMALVFSVPVCVGPFLWVMMFRRNKPEGYTEDFFDELLNKEGWSFAPQSQPAPVIRHENRRA